MTTEPAQPSRQVVALVLTLILLTGAVVLFEHHRRAGDLAVVPDSVEYATAAWNLADHGTYEILINGQSYPPRYAPWFPGMVLAPVYWIAGADIGAGVYAVLLWSLTGVVGAFLLGHAIGKLPGAVLAACGLLLLPEFREWARQIMTDSPAAGLTVLLCFLYVKLSGEDRPWRDWLFAGAVAAAAIAVRPTAAATLLPFVVLLFRERSRKGAPMRAALLLLPVLALLAAQGIRQQIVFGSPCRSGYHLWCPVPYDYTSLTFSAAYLPANVDALMVSFLPLLAVFLVLGCFILRRRTPARALPPPARRVIHFLILGTGPVVIFHLVYFFADSRFFLPASATAVALAGALVGALLARTRPAFRLPVLGVFLVLTLGAGVSDQRPVPTRRIAAERLAAVVPRGALVISSIDPVMLGHCLGRDRHILPLSRRAEYASKIIAWERVPHPEPRPKHSRDHRCPGLLAGGGIDVFPFVAIDPPGIAALRRELAAGTRVFLDTSNLTALEPEAVIRLQEQFGFEPRAENVYELKKNTD